MPGFVAKGRERLGDRPAFWREAPGGGRRLGPKLDGVFGGWSGLDSGSQSIQSRSREIDKRHIASMGLDRDSEGDLCFVCSQARHYCRTGWLETGAKDRFRKESEGEWEKGRKRPRYGVPIGEEPRLNPTCFEVVDGLDDRCQC